MMAFVSMTLKREVCSGSRADTTLVLRNDFGNQQEYYVFNWLGHALLRTFALNPIRPASSGMPGTVQSAGIRGASVLHHHETEFITEDTTCHPLWSCDMTTVYHPAQRGPQ